jgi:predicted short-subunit dehydrogenase-like oxidoreductase (DUF2520 family)
MADAKKSTPTDKPDIAIIGPGAVGSVVGILARRAGYRVAAVAGGAKPDARENLARTLGASAMTPAEAARAARLVLLTVRDDAIASLCEDLARAGALAHKPTVAHCCGAAGSEILTPAGELGCQVGSMHPMQTFPSIDAAVATLPGTYFSIEGTGPACDTLEHLARDIGGKTLRINAADKPLYHAAAVMGANYLTTMLDAALEMFVQAGLERGIARRAIAPLARAAVENTLSKDAPQALTGPLARGDLETIAAHLAAMRRAGTSEPTQKLYRQAALRTIPLARAKGSADKPTIEALTKLLSE